MPAVRFEKRFLLLAISVLEMLLFSGIIYGWTSLVYILKQEGYFSDHCETTSANTTQQNTQVNCQVITNTSTQDAPCYPACLEQDETLTQVFAISVVASQVASLFAGIALDYFGLRFIRTCFSVMMATAALLLGFSTREYPYVYLVYPGMILVGMCANITLLANVTVGNLFGSRRSTVITIITGSFGSSPVTFLVQKMLYVHFGVPFQHMCFALACLSVPSLLATFTLFPKRKFLPNSHQEKRKDSQETEKLQKENKSGAGVESGTARPNEETFVQVVTSRLYLLHLAYMSVMNLNVIILVGTANIWFNMVTGNNNGHVSFWTDVFGFFQVSNVLVSPLCGFVYDLGLRGHAYRGPTMTSRRRAAVPVFIITSLTSSLVFFFATLSVWDTSSVESSTGLLMTSAPDMLLTFVLHVVSRAFIYGGNTAFIANSFPAKHLGRLIGMSYLVAGLLGLLQYPLIGWIKAAGSPFYVYIFVLVLSVVTFGHPIYISYHCRDVSGKDGRHPSQSSLGNPVNGHLKHEACDSKETCV
ncbi:equilibrative nucleobase transporter 1-like isoform X2 [Branchiostoma lanceolatum]|uniref:equilibrative nucleobase transporter 1-like isoform X2 n=1 Tax=Branchiostoma lanceolatum TaxID=7740 RepID=UPI0034514E74